MKIDKVLQIFSSHNSSTVYEVDRKYLETWVGKPKGLLDICYERGLLEIDKYDLDDLNKEGKNDSSGEIFEGTNLSVMLGSCTDLTK